MSEKPKVFPCCATCKLWLADYTERDIGWCQLPQAGQFAFMGHARLTKRVPHEPETWKTEPTTCCAGRIRNESD